MAEVDAVVMLFEPYGELTEAEQALVEDIRVKKVPALAAVNKTDTLKKETDLAVRMQFLEELGVFRGVLPLCVSEDRGCTELLDALLPFAVESPHYFPDDAYTDMPEKALVAEVLREKMLLNLRDEDSPRHGCDRGTLQGTRRQGYHRHRRKHLLRKKEP